MNRGIHSIVLSIVILIYSLGCASQRQPTGGPKDETSPKLISSIPEHKSVGYKENLIELEFDEFVKVDDINNQLIITPRLDVEFEVKASRNTVTVEFEGELEDSTTYTFNFRKGIKDVTESNAARNMVLAFSTGSFLDSLSLSGSVEHLLNGEPSVEYTVAIYEATDTLDIFNSSPKYSTQSDEKGEYRFENIRSSAYRIYAFLDVNDNGTAQSNSEPFGFLENSISLDSNFQASIMYTQFLDVRPWNQISARQAGKYFEVKYNKHIVSYNLQPIDSAADIISLPRDENRTIKIFNTFPIEDSLRFQVSVQDSLGIINVDTISLRFAPTERDFEDFTLNLSSPRYQTANSNLEVEALFNKPAVLSRPDSIYLQLDSLTTFTIDTSAIFSWSNSNTLLKLSTPVPDSIDLTGATLTSGSMAFTSIENDSSALNTITVATERPEDFGLVMVKIETDKESYITQLLDASYNVMQQSHNQSSISFVAKPGDYYLRVLVDTNENGRWDPGNILVNELPEQVVFFEDPETETKLFTVRANWELGPYTVSF